MKYLLFLFFSFNVFANSPIKVYHFPNHPFTFESDREEGITAPLIKKIFTKANLNYILRNRSKNDSYINLLKYENSALGLIPMDKVKYPTLKWVGPILSDYLSFFAIKDIKIDHLSKLKTYSISVKKDSEYMLWLQSKIKNLKINDNEEENLTLLKENKVDIWATKNYYGEYLLKKLNILNVRQIARTEKMEFYLALHPSVSDELIKKLNDAVIELQKEGSLEK